MKKKSRFFLASVENNTICRVHPESVNTCEAMYSDYVITKFKYNGKSKSKQGISKKQIYLRYKGDKQLENFDWTCNSINSFGFQFSNVLLYKSIKAK